MQRWRKWRIVRQVPITAEIAFGINIGCDAGQAHENPPSDQTMNRRGPWEVWIYTGGRGPQCF